MLVLLSQENPNQKKQVDEGHLDFLGAIKELQVQMFRVPTVLQNKADRQLLPDIHLALKQKEMFSEVFFFSFLK